MDGPDSVLMMQGFAEKLPILRGPKPDFAVTTLREKPCPIVAEANPKHRFPVLKDYFSRFAIGALPQPGCPVEAARQKPSIVRTKGHTPDFACVAHGWT